MLKELSRRLTHAMNRIDAAYYIGEQGSGITDNALCVMYALDDGERHTQAEICRDWLIPKTTLNSLVKRWEKEGYIEKELSQEDKRERTLKLTGDGLVFAKKYLQRIYKAEEAAMQITLTRYGMDFVEAMEFYSQALEKGFQDGESLE